MLNARQKIKNYFKKIIRGYFKSSRIMKLEKKINRLEISITNLYGSLLEKRLEHENPKPGSSDWLILNEYKYGGTVKGIPKNYVSPNDPLAERQSNIGSLTGGDRMSEIEHNYAQVYAQHLEPFLKKLKIVLVEVGIFMGTGLTIWSDLFHKSRIIGLDIDLSHINNNMENLKRRGAFSNNNVELYEFDQFKGNRQLISDILKGNKIDIVIDDGRHLNEPILKTMYSFFPYLSDQFLYIIEDNRIVHKLIKKIYPELNVLNYDEITIVKNY